MFNYIKATSTFIAMAGFLLGTIMTFLLILYIGYMSVVILTIIVAIYIIKTIYDAKDFVADEF